MMTMELEEIKINVPWGKLAVLCRGDKNAQPIIMVHGNNDSAGTFFPLIEYFPPQLYIIMMDLPGCGKSSPFPRGPPLHNYDFVCSLKFVVDHFNINNFAFIGHSMGVQIGLLFHIIYPNHITNIVAIDHIVYPSIDSDVFPLWFTHTYGKFYDKSNYAKFTSPAESNPTYSFEQALNLVMKRRNITENAGRAVLKRALIPVENGRFRFCWEQRMKCIASPVFSTQYQFELYSKINVPHLTILATESIKSRGMHIMFDVEKAHFDKNPGYRIVVVEGNHDIHLMYPETVASHIMPFLMGTLPDRNYTAEFISRMRQAREQKELLKSKL